MNVSGTNDSPSRPMEPIGSPVGSSVEPVGSMEVVKIRCDEADDREKVVAPGFATEAGFSALQGLEKWAWASWSPVGFLVGIQNGVIQKLSNRLIFGTSGVSQVVADHRRVMSGEISVAGLAVDKGRWLGLVGAMKLTSKGVGKVAEAVGASAPVLGAPLQRGVGECPLPTSIGFSDLGAQVGAVYSGAQVGQLVYDGAVGGLRALYQGGGTAIRIVMGGKEIADKGPAEQKGVVGNSIPWSSNLAVAAFAAIQLGVMGTFYLRNSEVFVSSFAQGAVLTLLLESSDINLPSQVEQEWQVFQSPAASRVGFLGAKLAQVGVPWVSSRVVGSAGGAIEEMLRDGAKTMEVEGMLPAWPMAATAADCLAKFGSLDVIAIHNGLNAGSAAAHYGSKVLYAGVERLPENIRHVAYDVGSVAVPLLALGVLGHQAGLF